MSSIFQHVVHALGGGPVKFNVGTGAPVAPTKSQHLLVDSANAVYAATSGTPVNWQGGVPFDANGRVLITQSDVVARVGVGATPYDANGRIAVGGDTAHYNHGVAYSATGALAGTVPPAIPTTDQTVLTVGFIETNYGFLGDEPRGAVNPTVVFGQELLYLYGSTSSNRVILAFVGGVQIMGTPSITLTLTGGGLPPPPVSVLWNGALNRYDVISSLTVSYLQSQNGSNVTVAMERI